MTLGRAHFTFNARRIDHHAYISDIEDHGTELVAAPSWTTMTHRFLDWPPFRRAFGMLDYRKRGQESKMEEVVDIVQEAPGGVRVSLHLRRDGTFTFHLAC